MVLNSWEGIKKNEKLLLNAFALKMKENKKKKKEKNNKMLKFSFLSQHHAMNIKNNKPAAIFIEKNHTLEWEEEL